MSPVEAGSLAGYLSRIAETGLGESLSGGARVAASDASAFTAALEGAVAQANAQALSAQEAGAAFAAGARDDIHGTMVALSQADIEVRLVGSIRNKVIDAFHEIWKMQV